MKIKTDRRSDVERWFREQLAPLWPAALGSLSLRRSPCIRPRCHACETGEQHVSYVLYGRHQGRRFARYVPDRLVPEVRKALDNGRRLQELLYEAASLPPCSQAVQDEQALRTKRGSYWRRWMRRR